MKTIGILGGMSWESTETYYRLINEGVAEALGGYHSAKIAMVSVDFEEIEVLQREDRWDEAGAVLADASRRIESAGAGFLVIATNTMHKVVPAIENVISIPVLHIADAAAEAVAARGLSTVGLLGTAFTMEQPFYRSRLEGGHRGDGGVPAGGDGGSSHRLRVLTPGTEDRETVHRVIYGELVHGTIRVESRAAYLQVIERLVAGGAEGIILGCTEIGLLVGGEHTDVPLFDTTRIHAEAAVKEALR